ncbi:hypothetical protein MASR2M79_03030 [Aminivibrio sp.]
MPLDVFISWVAGTVVTMDILLIERTGGIGTTAPVSAMLYSVKKSCFDVILPCPGVKGDCHTSKGVLKLEVVEVVEAFPKEILIFVEHLRDLVDNFVGHILVGKKGSLPQQRQEYHRQILRRYLRG